MLRKVALGLFLFLAASTTVHAQYIPYFGKNNVKYDTFSWKTYKTTHFDVYFYPQEQEHLERVVSMAESAYDRISAQLQHDIEFRIPLIYFKTASEFEQVNYVQVSEGVLGVAEPAFNRMAFTIDLPSDILQDVIAHELTHVFEFSMLFGGILSPIVRSAPPGWVMEGFAEYMTAKWNPGDIMVVRDAVLTERMPFLSVDKDMIFPSGEEVARSPYTVGHAAFEFIHDKYGEAAIRQFWFYLKKATLLGSEEVIYSALGVKEEAFNEQFAHYLRDRFKDYRDKQSPIDYGKEVALNPKYTQILSMSASPNGKEFAIITINKDDYEWDILKVDREGKVLHNLTGGFTSSYDYLTTDDYRFEGRNISWSSDGSRLCYFARTGKRRSLFIVDATNGHRVKKIKMKLDQAASPSISPDGKTVLFTAFLNGQADMFLATVDTGNIKKVTNDLLLEKTPMWSPDGKWIFYTTRINSRDQIMKMSSTDYDQMQQLTNSDYDSTSPYYDPASNSVYFSSDRTGTFNLYRMDLATGDKIQYTDVIGANFSPIVFKENGKDVLAFTSFFKGNYRLFIMDLPTPLTVIASGSESQAGETLQKSLAAVNSLGSEADQASKSREFPQQGPVLSDFHPTKDVTVNEQKIQDKKLRLIVGGRPEVITGVSGDNFAVASGVVLQDILGDQEFRFFISRISGFQSYNAGYLDLGHRLQFLTDFNWNDDFFQTSVPGQVAQETGFPIDIVRSRLYGGRFMSQYPLNRYYRMEYGAGLFKLSEEFLEEDTQRAYERYLAIPGSFDFLSNGGYMPLSFAFVGETTRFREFGPIAGHTFRISVDYSPPVSDSWVSRGVYQADLRKYVRLNNRMLVAVRARGVYSNGRNPVIFSFGGGLDIRGFDFREIAGNKGLLGNVEWRFPVYPNPRFPFLGQMRGKIFVDYANVSYNNPFGFDTPQLSLSVQHVNDQLFGIYLGQGAGSVGAGFTVFAGGLPMNFDFSKVYGYGRFANDQGLITRTDPLQFEFTDGIKFDFSIGYDF